MLLILDCSTHYGPVMREGDIDLDNIGCLTAPSHYLVQCRLIINGVLWYSPEGTFMGILMISIITIRGQVHIKDYRNIPMISVTNELISDKPRPYNTIHNVRCGSWFREITCVSSKIIEWNRINHQDTSNTMETPYLNFTCSKIYILFSGDQLRFGCYQFIRVTTYGRHDVSNHRQLDCLLNCLIWWTTRTIPKLCITGSF